jgi:hypothetical protein
MEPSSLDSRADPIVMTDTLKLLLKKLPLMPKQQLL